jgi:serine/threonine-protein kinase RsbW
VATNDGEARVELSIPGRPEYVGVARLAILGVASRMRFSYDEVEDIRLAVGEACTTAIERTNEAGLSCQPIRIRCLIDSTQLVVEVRDNAPIPEPPPTPAAPPTLDERNLGGVLIRILMDEVENLKDPETGQRIVRMVKHVGHGTR